MSSLGSSLGSSGLGGGVAANLGRAASVGSLSVPQAWAAANQAVTPAARALPLTSLTSAAVCTAWAAAAGAKPFNIELKVLVIDTPELVIDMWLLAIDTMLLIGDRCGETVFHRPPSLEEGVVPCVGWASCCSAWGTLFINWFAAAVSEASSTAAACSRSPPALVISGASSNGSNVAVAVAVAAA
ncbi:PE/PPE C-terminal domain-containing protein [Mycobacterium tuberculosis]|uniref:PE/PPE C-terminal domain-containing protein n=1 Tax=Mycobacterium tuberculosis TaxID=1773 RepID=UPI003F4ADCF1